MTRYIPRWFTRLQTVRPSTNPAVHSREMNSTCWSQVRRPNHYTTKKTLSLYQHGKLQKLPNFIPVRFETTEPWTYFNDVAATARQRSTRWVAIWHQFVIQSYVTDPLACNSCANIYNNNDDDDDDDDDDVKMLLLLTVRAGKWLHKT